MRLAGGWHISFDEQGKPVYNQSRIISASGKKYSYEDLRQTIPHPKPEVEPPIFTKVRQRSLLKPVFKQGDSLPRHPNEIQIPVPARIPLYNCCRIEAREWIDTGVQKGNKRNDKAWNLAQELVGVERYLTSIGQSFEGTAEELFHEYCQKSGMSSSEELERLEWAKGTNPTPSCKTDVMENIIRNWFWKEHVKPFKNNTHNGFRPNPMKNETTAPNHNGNNNGHGAGGNHNGTSSQSILMQIIDELLDQNMSESRQNLALVELAKDWDNYNAKEIRSVAAKRIEERYLEDTLRERRSDLEYLQKLLNFTYEPFDDLFYASPSTAERLKLYCKQNPIVQPEYFLGIFAPYSSLVGTKGSANVPKLGLHHGIINIGLVAESGEGKSVISSILENPLYRLNDELQDMYDQQKKEYEEAVSAWEQEDFKTRGPKPKEDEYITVSDAYLIVNEYTREGLVQNLADNPNHSVHIHQEELVSMWRIMNQYRKGKGDDHQFFNNIYDSKPINRILKGERIRVEKPTASIFGGIQPPVLFQEMGDMSDADGHWARFNFIVAKQRWVRTNLFEPSIDISGLIHELYRKTLLASSVECHFDHEGLELLQQFMNQVLDKKWETLEEGKRYILSKATSEVIRMAIDLHWMNSLITGDTVPEVIPAIAVRKAIKFKKFFLQQMQIIRMMGSASTKAEQGLAPVYQTIIRLCERRKHTDTYLTTRQVLSTKNSVFKNLKAKDIEKLFLDMELIGIAKTVIASGKRTPALLISSVINGGGGNNGPGGGNSPSPTPNKPDGGNITQHLPKKQPSSVLFSLNNFNQPTTSDYLFGNQKLANTGSMLEQIKPSGMPDTKSSDSFAGLLDLKEGDDQSSKNIQKVKNIPEKNTANTDSDEPTSQQDTEPIQTDPANPQQTEEQSETSQNVKESPPPSIDVVEDCEPNPKNSEKVSEEPSSSESPSTDRWENDDSIESRLALCWLQKFLADLESESPSRFTSCKQLEQLYREMEEKAAICWEELLQLYPDYFDRVSRELGRLVEILPSSSEEEVKTDSPESESSPEEQVEEQVPTVAELQAQLLACQTLVDLRRFRKQYQSKKTKKGRSLASLAYVTLSEEQQSKIDALSATSVPYEVYKYTGQPIVRDGQKLNSGTLVYIDPNTEVRKGASLVPVWLLRGAYIGWLHAVQVSRHFLTLVEKAVTETVAEVEVHQFNLLDWKET